MYPKLICFRVMMPQHTSSPLWWMFFPCILRSLERYTFLWKPLCNLCSGVRSPFFMFSLYWVTDTNFYHGLFLYRL
jgi:hypothetical protein